MLQKNVQQQQQQSKNVILAWGDVRLSKLTSDLGHFLTATYHSSVGWVSRVWWRQIVIHWQCVLSPLCDAELFPGGGCPATDSLAHSGPEVARD